MRLIRTFHEAPDRLKHGVVALGNFDGLHKGHQAVIGAAVTRARAEGRPAGVMTFEPHPRQLFRPQTEPFRLSPFRIKARLIEAMGVDYLYVQTFEREFSQRSAENFITEILAGGLNVSHVVVGHDYVFGHQRRGTVELLRAMSADHGFEVTAIAEMKGGEGSGTRYSSSNIRAFLAEGRCLDAARLLGRYWEVEGRVEAGDRRGRTLGFPTANIALGDYMHPLHGVYAVRAGIDHGAGTRWHDGVANFGHRPTFNKTDVLLEVHLFGVNEDLYHRHLRVALVEHLRPERKFDGLDALKAQIAADCVQAKERLAMHGFTPDAAPFVAADEPQSP